MQAILNAIAELEAKRNQMDALIADLRRFAGSPVEPVKAQNNTAPATASRRGRPPKVTSDKTPAAGGFACSKCGADEFTTPQGLGRHRSVCDGVRRTAKERLALASQRYFEKKNSKTPKVKRTKAETSAPTPPPNPRSERPDPDVSPDAGQSEDTLSRIAEAANRRQAPPSTGPELLFSHPMTCPKCGALGTRFKRTREAEYWICEAKKCALKVANYNIKTDKHHQPAMAMGAGA